MEANFLENAEECVFQFDISSSPSITPPIDENSDDDVSFIQAQIQALQEQVFAMQKGRKQKFDGVEPPRRVGPPKQHTSQPSSSAKNEENRSRSPPPQSSNPPPPVPNVFGRPGARAGQTPSNPLPQRPQGPMKPVEIIPKPVEDPKFRYTGGRGGITWGII